MNAALPTARIAKAEKMNGSNPPIKSAAIISGLTKSTTTEETSIPTSFAYSARYAWNRRSAANPAEPKAYPFVNALVVFPAASNESILSLSSLGAPDISAIPAALSTIGPKPSIPRIIPATESIPIVATAVP